MECIEVKQNIILFFINKNTPNTFFRLGLLNNLKVEKIEVAHVELTCYDRLNKSLAARKKGEKQKKCFVRKCYANAIDY
jgi:hypothetical protein